MTLKTLSLSGCALFALATFNAAPAMAQSGASSAEEVNTNDIIVTARRRDETAQETPVALTVLNDELLERYGVKGVASIAQLTPGLFTGEATGSVGGSISLRGIGAGESQPFIDQAVSVNVDGVQISSAQILRAAQMDLKQIEVLRGPQALFFGKNSPGGIISLTTADAGDRLEALLRGGYEFKADEWYLDGTVSTPLGENAGLRLAAHYGQMKGYITLFNPVVAGQSPTTISRFPKQNELFLRGTLNFDPSDAISIRLKATYTDTDTIGGASYFSDIVYCPYGVPQRPSEDAGNCLNDGVAYTSILPAIFMPLSPYLENPNGNRNNEQTLLSGQIDFKLSDALSLTSVTSYYGIREKNTSNGAYGPVSNNGFAIRFKNDQFSQELRLASKFDGPLNFMLGGFYEHRKLYTLTFIGVPQFQLRLPQESTNQKQESASVFGQLMFDLSPNVQITAGGRYTHETKNLVDYTVEAVGASGLLPGVDVTKLAAYPGGPNPKLSYNDFSPEVTLTWKPNDDIMVFASYKEGFKSGGFDAGFTNGAILSNPARLALGQTFKPEHVKGGEIGIKTSLADRQLTLNLTGYYYDYDDLQVSVFDTVARAFRLQNAARARIKGIELDTSFRPRSLPGFNLHASAAINDSKYRDFIGDCYAGQTVANGCNQVFAAAANQAAPGLGATVINGVAGFYTAQNLSGRRLRKAPVFSATFGGYYEFPVTSGLMVSLSSDLSYSGEYNVGTQLQPWSIQPAHAKLDATMRLFTEDKRWELALIGRNLTNRRNLINGIDRTGTGGAKGANAPTCSTITGTDCIKTADLIGTAALPRTVALQFTFKY